MEKSTLRRVYGKGKYLFKKHIVDTTAVLTIASPIFAASETLLGDFPDEQSIRAKILAATVLYLGVGSISSRGRDLSRWLFGITGKSKEKIQGLHDSLYNCFFNAALFAPAFYHFTGTAETFRQYAVGIGFAGLYGLGAGFFSGYAIDVGRDLIGLEECERRTYPKRIKILPQRAKKAVAAAAVAASISLCSLVYALTPDKVNFQEIIHPPKQEQRIESTDTGKLEQILVQ